jgi:hypothetical protein
MIIGAHAIIYSTNSDADRAFLRDILELTHVDVGGGWLIFGLPPAEVAVHPADDGGTHELYLMSDDIGKFCERMALHGIETATVQNAGWGLLTQVTLPGGGKLGVYQPRHARPDPMGGAQASPARKPARAPARKSAARKAGARKSGARSAKKSAAKKTARKR